MTGTSLPTLIQPSTTGAGRFNYNYEPLSYNGCNGKTSIFIDVVGTGPASLTWNNSAGGNGTSWDIANNKNWTSTAATGNPNEFFQGDNVTFNDSNNSNYNVSLNTAVNPSSVTVNTTGAYVISGTGSIGGTGALSMSGGGTLTLATANTFAGGTTLNSGALNINTNSALGSGALTINGGSLGNTSAGAVSAANAQTWASSFTFNGPQPLALNGAVSLHTNPTITVSTSTLTLGGIISGTTGNQNLIYAGNGTLILNGAPAPTPAPPKSKAV